MESKPDQEWWTAAEIADAALIDMPTTVRGVSKLAERLGWRGHASHARRRKGRGGGWEYHYALFPMRTQRALVPLEMASGPQVAFADRDEAWQCYEGLSDKAKAEAERRLGILQKVEALTTACQGKALAAEIVAREAGITARTIWNWFELIQFVDRADRLPYLAPRREGRRPPRKPIEISEEFMDRIKADYLRLGGPSFSSCYRRVEKLAKRQGWEFAPEATVRRRFKAEVSKTTEIYCRKGLEALEQLYPPQRRDKLALSAMEAVNADYHKWDVFVRWPTPGGKDELQIIRPQMVAFQDIYSGRILSWRLSMNPNKVDVALALGDMIERFGIPQHVLLDNGREFANKFLTGRVATRFRFKVKDDDIPGILTALGCEVHWATPYSGQSKPIERAFRDLCDTVAKDPRFDGAYTGNSVEAKPENYGSRAIGLEQFLSVVSEGIEEHNARPGRRSDVARGRSLIAAFEASYEASPITKATPEQRRLWLMGAEGVRAKTKTGEITFQGNTFYSDWMVEIAGEKVVVRFDPADFAQGLHVYDLSNRYLGHAAPREMAGFFDMAEARDHAAARRRFVNAEKAAAEEARKLGLLEYTAELDALSNDKVSPADSEAKVLRPVFKERAPSSLKPAPMSSDEEAARVALMAEHESKRAKPKPKENERDVFRRAIELEERLAANEPVTKDQKRWLISYQQSAEYRAQKDLFERFGKDMLG